MAQVVEGNDRPDDGSERRAGDEPARRPGLRDSLQAFRHRNFTLFWVGALLSNSGTWMQNIAVPYVVLQMTHSATWVGVAGFCQMLPIFLFGPVGGWLADRFPRRTVLLVTQAAAAVEAFVLWALWVHGVDSVWPLLVLLLVSGSITGLTIPSWQAFVTELVPRDVLLNAVTLNSAQFNAARFVGPLVGAPVLATLGAGACFFVNGVSFVTVLGALLLMRLPRVARPPAERSSPFRIFSEFVEASRATRDYPGIRASFYAVFALGALGGPLASLLAVFADRVFHVGPVQYGYLSIAMGAGSVLAAPFIAGPGAGVLRSRLLLISMTGYGIALVVFAASDLYAVGFVALFATSAGWLGIASTLNTTIQLQVPEAIRGKVLALYVMLLTLAMPIGVLAQGVSSDHLGPQITVLIAGLLFLAVTMWLWRLSGLFGHLDDDGALLAPLESTVVEGVDGCIEVEEGLPVAARVQRDAPPAR